MKSVVVCAVLLGIAARPPRLPAEETRFPVAAIEDPQDRAILEALVGHARALAAKLTRERFAAQRETEMLCWTEFPQMDVLLTAYELTGDVEHLRGFAQALTNLLPLLRTAPDGFRGWLGPFIESRRDPKDPEAEADEIQKSFRAVTIFSRFLEIVAREERLRAEFGEWHPRLLDLMENHLVKKWDARGNWMDLGDRGGIYRLNDVHYRPTISMPWEKLVFPVQGMLALFRVTGRDFYLRRAVAMGTLFKRTLVFEDGRYRWYRWVPFGDWDIHPAQPNRWASWIGYSPLAQWYRAEVDLAVDLYHHGLVFDRTDMDRFVRTQMEVAWNGDPESPVYQMIHGKPSDRPNQVFLADALAPFDAKLAEFCFVRRRSERFEKRNNEWQGGVLAREWLRQKFIVLPAAAGGEPAWARFGEQFRSNPENRAWLERIAFTVEPPGFRMPMSPAQMDPMPRAPVTHPPKAETP